MSTPARPRILPSNSTKFERDLLEGGTRAIRIIDETRPGVYRSKRVDIPDSWVPWLLAEYGLPKIMPFIKNERRAIDEGPMFVRKIGTAWAVQHGLEWLGHTDTLIEEEPLGPHWFEFQLGLERVPETMDELADIVGVARVAKPYSRKNSRIYSGYDVRPFVLDESIWDDEGLFDDYSGVTVQPDWPRMSFGKEYGWIATWAPGKPAVSISTEYVLALRASYMDAPRWDMSRFDSEVARQEPDFVFGTETSFGLSADFGTSERDFEVTTILKAMTVFDDQWLWDDGQHTFFRTQLVESGNIHVFDDSRWDIDGVTVTEQPINELFFNDMGMVWEGTLHNTVGWGTIHENAYHFERDRPLQFGLSVDSVLNYSVEYSAQEDWPDLPWQNDPWGEQTTNVAIEITTRGVGFGPLSDATGKTLSSSSGLVLEGYKSNG